MPTKKLSVFETLSKIDVSNHVETIRMRKGPALKYVSWAWAWAMVKSKFPDAQRKIEEYPEYRYDKNTGKWYATGQMLDYRVTPAGCEVKVTVTIAGEEYSERLYVMDMRNQPVHDPDISQINKTQQRCLVKALAMAGLGLNLYAGEDLPMGDIAEKDQQESETKQEKARSKAELNKVLSDYRTLLPKTAEALGLTTGELEKQVKEKAESNIANFDKLPAINRGAQMNNILKNMLNENDATEQGSLFEEA